MRSAQMAPTFTELQAAGMDMGEDLGNARQLLLTRFGLPNP